MEGEETRRNGIFVSPASWNLRKIRRRANPEKTRPLSYVPPLGGMAGAAAGDEV